MSARCRHWLPLLCVAFLVIQGTALRESIAERGAKTQRQHSKAQGASTKKSAHRARSSAKIRPLATLRVRSRSKSAPLRGDKVPSAKSWKRQPFSKSTTSKPLTAKQKAKTRVNTKTSATTRSSRLAKPQRNPQRAFKALRKGAARVKALPTVKRIGNRIARFSAATTRKLDQVQARAPPWLARTISGIRTYSIVSLAAFNVSYAIRDKKFLGTLFAASSIFSYVLIPAALSIGMNPVTATIVNVLSSPLTAIVLVMRDVQLKRRAGETATMAKSAKSILRDYKTFATDRQAKKSKRAFTMAGAKR